MQGQREKLWQVEPVFAQETCQVPSCALCYSLPVRSPVHTATQFTPGCVRRRDMVTLDSHRVRHAWRLCTRQWSLLLSGGRSACFDMCRDMQHDACSVNCRQLICAVTQPSCVNVASRNSCTSVNGPSRRRAHSDNLHKTRLCSLWSRI